MSVQSCLKWLVEVKPSNERVGPLVVVGLLNDSMKSRERKAVSNLTYQVCLLSFALLCLFKMKCIDYRKMQVLM